MVTIDKLDGRIAPATQICDNLQKTGYIQSDVCSPDFLDLSRAWYSRCQLVFA
jgi:hypothetical protein